MATTPIRVDLDLNQNEIQNAVIQNLASAPANPKEGQIYFNTASHIYYGYKNGSWVLLDSQGMAYAAGNGIDSTAFNNGTIQVSTTIASKTDIGSANLTIQRNGTGIGTFSANATSPTTVNISVPTTATEVGALPSSTVIGDGKAIFKKNGSAFATITANQTSTINVDYTVPTTVAELSDSSNYALKSDVASAVIPKGSISAVSGLPTLVADHRGWMYNFSAEFTTTSDFVEGSGKKYPAGTNVVVVEYTAGTYKYDVFAGFIDTTAYDNHIADTTIHVTATDKSNWNGKQDALGYTPTKKFSANNTALTTSGGVCTWSITNSIGSADVQVSLVEILTGNKVIASVAVGASTITVKINSSTNIAANTYKVIVIG